MESVKLMFDEEFERRVTAWAFPVMRIGLALISIWFGALKLMGTSPATQVVSDTYSFLPTGSFLPLVGFVQVYIGIALITRFTLRVALVLLFAQLFSGLLAPLFNPSVFFVHSNPFFITTEGESLVKNFVLFGAMFVMCIFSEKQKEKAELE